MYTSKALTVLAFAVSATLASPFQPEALDARDVLRVLEARDVTWTCQNSVEGVKKYSQNTAEGNFRAEPWSSSFSNSPSSYPHWFKNCYTTTGALDPKCSKSDVIHFGVAECDKAPIYNTADTKDSHFLVELPVFPNGCQYNTESCRPKDDPGPARILYTWPGKTFCGIVSHVGNAVLKKEPKDGEEEFLRKKINGGNLVLCSKN